MGVAYEGVGGIGVLVNDEIITACIEHGVFTEEEYSDDRECISELELPYAQAGSYYSGDVVQYLFVEGRNFNELNTNVTSFIDKLKSIGVEITENDIKVISDLLIY